MKVVSDDTVVAALEVCNANSRCALSKDCDLIRDLRDLLRRDGQIVKVDLYTDSFRNGPSVPNNLMGMILALVNENIGVEVFKDRLVNAGYIGKEERTIYTDPKV